ncbi:MAG: hypothetical protein U9R74_00450 [Pseudomonadota bacterium]|nr:hypothetical protein [Pseudomonadota bacterium]
MSQISNDIEFKQALQNLDATQSRVVAALFIEHVLPLCEDERINRVVKVATDSNASEDEIADALRSAKAATFDSHTRCGSEGNWTEQAGYFVARAAVAAVTPLAQSRASGPAWQAAMSCRMAQTSLLIDNESDQATDTENEWQYNILSDYLRS